MFNKIDKLSKTEFTEVFGNIFENASWIAEKLYAKKPFKNFEDLSNQIIFIFENTSNQNKLKILNSHPDLADKTKIGSLTQDSKNEQKYAGLEKCTNEEFNEFKNLNVEYKRKFGFPFIIAVKNKNKFEILENFKERILSNKGDEFEKAVQQVKKIANLRLDELKTKFL